MTRCHLPQAFPSRKSHNRRLTQIYILPFQTPQFSFSGPSSRDISILTKSKQLFSSIRPCKYNLRSSANIWSASIFWLYAFQKKTTGRAPHQTEADQWDDIKETASKIFSRVYFIHACCTLCASNFSSQREN